jgi:hypothetical protein
VDQDEEEDDDEASDEDIAMYGELEEEEDDDDENEDSGKGAGRDPEHGPRAGGGAVTASFDFSDPDEKFFFGIRGLLKNFRAEVRRCNSLLLARSPPPNPPRAIRFRLQGVDTSRLAELIVEQAGLGTVVNCTDEEDVFAFASMLNMSFHKVRRV